MKRNRNEILPIFNYEPATEIRAVKPESKVGQIIDRCSGDGAKASELLPSFVKKTGEPWRKTAIEGVFRWDLPHKGYGIRTIPDPAGIDHTYVTYAGSKGRNMELIESYEDVEKNVRAFNEGLESSQELQNRLGTFTIWYYIHSEDAVGPSKFIGYRDMTAEKYFEYHDKMDGRETEQWLGKKQWFRKLDEDTPEYVHVKRKVDDLVNKFGKPAKTSARYHAPVNWKLNALNTILYGPPGTGKTYETTRRCVEICDGPVEGSDEDTRRDIRKRYRALVDADRIEFITFHQSYGYEEFVEGLRPVTDSADASAASGAGFRLAPTLGVLRRIAERARKKPHEAHVLVIDEINRANVSKVLGELVTLLEEDKREGAENEVVVTLPHSEKRFTLPSNLHILGTMNTADRSIALLDTALRRRFEFQELAPDPDALQDAKKATGIDLPEVLRAMNQRLEWLIDRDHLIGHAWLMKAQNRDDVDRIMRHKIIPLIAEYFYDDWEKVHAVLGGTGDFVEGLPLDPPPGFDDTGENRRRWTVREEFDERAYDGLVAGRSAPAPDTGDTE